HRLSFASVYLATQGTPAESWASEGSPTCGVFYRHGVCSLSYKVLPVACPDSESRCLKDHPSKQYIRANVSVEIIGCWATVLVAGRMLLGLWCVCNDWSARLQPTKRQF